MPAHKIPINPTDFGRRRVIISVLAPLPISIAACQPTEKQPNELENKSIAKERESFTYLDVSLFNYLDRSIFDVYLNGIDIGVAKAFGGGGLMSGVKVPIGPQSISWRLGGPKGTPGNGDTIHAANTPVLRPPPSTHHYLGIHIYPDNSVDLIAEQFWPEPTKRGLALRDEWRIKNGE